MKDKISWKLTGVFKADAGKCYEEIKNIGENITPSDVLKYAQDENTELHKCFEWDDGVAAIKYRLHQARNVIQLLSVDVGTEEKQPVRVFQISSTRNNYMTTTKIFENVDEYASLLKRAKSECQNMMYRYRTLNEMETVFDAMRELLTD